MAKLEAYTSAQRAQDIGAVDPITGMRIVPRDPFVCFADGDPSAGPPGGGKTFTQEELDRIVKQRLKKSERELEQALKRAEAAEKQLEELSSKVDSLTSKLEESGKSDIEKELAKAQRQAAQLQAQLEKAEQERAELAKQAEQAVHNLTRARLETTLRDALRTNRAHGMGMDQAVRLMLADGAQFDEDGNFIMKVGDVPYDKPEEATKKWLELNPHFQEGSGGGSGTPRAGGTKLVTPKQMDEMGEVSLIATGLSNPLGNPRTE